MIGSIGVADLRSKILSAPLVNFFFHFYAIFRKIWQNNRLATPLENSGSATEHTEVLL